MGHHPSLAAAAHDVTQRVEQLALQIVHLGRILPREHHVGTTKSHSASLASQVLVAVALLVGGSIPSV